MEMEALWKTDLACILVLHIYSVSNVTGRFESNLKLRKIAELAKLFTVRGGKKKRIYAYIFTEDFRMTHKVFASIIWLENSALLYVYTTGISRNKLIFYSLFLRKKAALSGNIVLVTFSVNKLMKRGFISAEHRGWQLSRANDKLDALRRGGISLSNTDS